MPPHATRNKRPQNTQVFNAAGEWLATFTPGARIVRLVGPSRTFSEPGLTATFTTDNWVRLLATPYAGAYDPAWLTARLADITPDALAIAMQYITAAPALYSGAQKIAGDASYGPLVGGVRQEGSDFNDFLGLPWTYDSGTDQPEGPELNCLDCSGFVRMVYGYRMGMPLTLEPDSIGLPRTSANQATYGVGVATTETGDLLFFDADAAQAGIDHVGIYLGLDSGGHRRFISSRKSSDGPTFGDVGSLSIIDGTAYWARAYRSARRP